MKINKRALALILSIVMVLTFMPAMAFADAGGAQAEKKAKSLKYIGSLEYEPGGVDSEGYKYGPYFSGWDEPGNKVIITWEDNSTTTFVCKLYDMTNDDGSPATAVGYFPEDVKPHVVPREGGGSDADNDTYIDHEVDENGQITISYIYGYDGEDASISSGPLKGITVASLKYDGPAAAYEISESPQEANPYIEGAKIIIGYTDGTSKTAVCKTWKAKYDGKEATYYEYFLEGVEPDVKYDEEDGYPYTTNSVYFDFDYENATAEGLPFEYKNVKGLVPVTQEEPELDVPDKMWAGQTYWTDIYGASMTSLKSSKKTVVAVKKSSYYDELNVKHPAYILNAKKAGKATVTAGYKTANGKTGTVKKTVTVKKYPNHIKSLKVEGKTVKISKNKFAYSKKVSKSKKSVKIKMALKKGWKISSVVGYQYNNKSGKEMKVTKKMLTKGSAISFGKTYKDCMIQVVFKKGKDTIFYDFYFHR